jgi:predicted P-loop ATPase
MCGAVKRVFEPGCKFDSMLVLVGGQGIGKSRLGYILSRGWFTDSLTRMDGKEAYEAIRGAWIVELSELAAARKSEIEAQKQFVSAQVDNYRPAYGKNVAEFKRQCVFYATTNDTEPLRDNTGARRYWPVQCPGVNEGQHIGLEEEVDQLWAEAVVRYRAGESLWLDDAGLAGYAQVMQEAYSERDEWFGLIQEYLDIPITPDWESKTPEERRAWIRGDSLETWDELDLVQRETVSSVEIRVECFGEDRAGVKGGDSASRRVAKIMGQMPGWKKQKTLRRVAGYGPQRWYARKQ